MDKISTVLSTTKAQVWNYGETGAWISAAVASVGTFFTGWLGGWDNMVKALIWFMAIDFALGFIASLKAHKTDSKVMLWGGINKVLVLVFVGVGVILDRLVGMPEPYIRTAIIWFYIGREGLSIVENYGKIGLPLPSFVPKLLEQLKEKGDKGGTKTEEAKQDANEYH